MRILVMGGNRFFGKRFIANLLQRGHEVTSLNRGSRDDGFGDAIQRIQCDRRDSARLESETAKASQGKIWDIVFDNICFEASEAREASRIFNGKVGRYIVTSSQSVYQPGANVSESAFDPKTYRYKTEVTLAQDYAEGKRQMEQAIFESASFPVVTVRFPIVLGTDDYTERLHFHVRKALNEEPIYFPSLTAKIPFIDSQNAADALEALATDPHASQYTGPINLCSPHPIVIADLLQWIEAQTGHSMNVVSTAKLSETSPFGIKNDWYMSTELAQSLKIPLRTLDNWLPRLIKEIHSSVANEMRV